MGCGGSKDQGHVVQTGRRRLSVSDTGAPQEGESESATEEDRGLITSLNGENVVDILNSAGMEGMSRKMSIGSNTDASKATQFSKKTVQEIGNDFNPNDCGIGYTCRKGLKPESPNQDSFFVLKTETKSMYAVFDGHGSKGHDVSQFVKECLPKLLLKDQNFLSDNNSEVEGMMSRVFNKTQKLIMAAEKTSKLSASMSGTTATVVLHDTKNKILHVAHVADSTAVLGGKTARAITLDHKPDLKAERARIEKNGGRVVFDGYANHRVYAKNARYPGLNMSRCLGDLLGYHNCGISCEPDVSHIRLTPDDTVLLVCSDGVWEFIEPAEAVKIVLSDPAANASMRAEKLAKQAWDRWIAEEGGSVVDDITVIVALLNQGEDGEGSTVAQANVRAP